MYKTKYYAFVLTKESCLKINGWNVQDKGMEQLDNLKCDSVLGLGVQLKLRFSMKLMGSASSPTEPNSVIRYREF